MSGLLAWNRRNNISAKISGKKDRKDYQETLGVHAKWPLLGGKIISLL